MFLGVLGQPPREVMVDEADELDTGSESLPFDVQARDPGPELFAIFLDRTWSSLPSAVDQHLVPESASDPTWSHALHELDSTTPNLDPDGS